MSFIIKKVFKKHKKCVIILLGDWSEKYVYRRYVANTML